MLNLASVLARKEFHGRVSASAVKPVFRCNKTFCHRRPHVRGFSLISRIFRCTLNLSVGCPSALNPSLPRKFRGGFFYFLKGVFYVSTSRKCPPLYPHIPCPHQWTVHRKSLSNKNYQELYSMKTTNENDKSVVLRKSLGHYSVHINGQEIDCELSSRLHKELIYYTSASLKHKVQSVREVDKADPVAIGDHVRFVDAGAGRGMITEILPRRSKLSRPLPIPGQRVFEQVIVANADQVLTIFAASNPSPKWGLLDRYLVTAEAAGLPSRIVITKMDLATQNKSLEQDLEIYRRIGYPIHLVCSSTSEGLEELKQALHGAMSVLVGKSGVGKTSLMNALQTRPRPACKRSKPGRYRQRQAHHQSPANCSIWISAAGWWIRPGMREFGLWDISPEDLASLFPELAPHIGQCKFGLSCRHNRTRLCHPQSGDGGTSQPISLSKLFAPAGGAMRNHHASSFGDFDAVTAAHWFPVCKPCLV